MDVETSVYFQFVDDDNAWKMIFMMFTLHCLVLFLKETV